MELSASELARLDQMFDSAQVFSEPEALSGTDRMMDAMVQKAHARREALTLGPKPPIKEHSRSEAVTGTNTGLSYTPQDDSSIVTDPPRKQGTPRTLEDLISIRRALVRNEQPLL